MHLRFEVEPSRGQPRPAFWVLLLAWCCGSAIGLGACRGSPGDVGVQLDAGSDWLPDASVDGGDVPAVTLTPVTFDVIPTTEPDFVAPGRGANTFFTRTQSVQIPIAGQMTWALDNDVRFRWRNLEVSRGVYSWTQFDTHIQDSIARRQRVSFGIAAVCSTCTNTDTVDGAYILYPTYLHQAMQAETVQDWKYGGFWIPNWNSETYLTRWEELLAAVSHHIQTTSYRGIAFRDVIYRIDARGYGNWGEWHTAPWRDCRCIPAGAGATEVTLKRILDAFPVAFPNYPLVLLVGTFGGEHSEALSYHALTLRNAWGPLGWRSDHMGSVRPYYPGLTYENPRVVNGVGLRSLIMDRWKTSPIVGEPMPNANDVSNDGAFCTYYNLPHEISLFHHSQFSNANSVSAGTPCADENFREASKRSGYRLILGKGGFTATVDSSRALSIELSWQNVGVSPTYERWNVSFELRNEMGGVAWTGPSAMELFRFLPDPTPHIVRDDFVLPERIVSGAYTLHLVIRDPTGYRDPLPLAIRGRAADGSYPIGSLTVR